MAGEYIAVEKVENCYKECREVEQIWVYGSSLESVLVAVVVPKEPALQSWATTNNVQGSIEVRVEGQVHRVILDQRCLA